jgi:curved DNA-binding protein CbpA
LAAYDEPTSVPRPVAGFDPSSASLGALERHVLAQVDGRTSFTELGDATGLDPDDLRRMLQHLVEAGAVHPAPNAASAAAPGDGAAAAAATDASNGAAASAADGAAGGDVAGVDVRALMAEPCDLDVEIRAKILELFLAIDDLDHYALLGVERDADRKVIKSAYYALAAKLHTDRYFGKNLGSFKSKMEAVFGRITVAHDTLASKPRRAEYDEYLADRDRTRAYEQLLEWATVDSASPMPGPARVFKPPPPPSRAGALQQPPAPTPTPAPVAPISPAPAATTPARSPVPAATAVPTPTPTPARVAPVAPLTPEQERARRLAAAQRLMGNRPSQPRQPAAPPAGSTPRLPAVSAEQARAATETLRTRYFDSVEQARRTSIQRLVETADAAVAKEDFVTAANQLRLALNHGDDPVLRTRYEELNARARQVLADSYLKQGAYEESQEKWREAGVSYAKAVEARPDDPAIAAKAANALRREGKDLHRAARFAEAAVQKNPASAEFRVTLGQVYLDAGLLKRAVSELEQATRLAPDDAKVKDLLTRARKASGA